MADLSNADALLFIGELIDVSFEVHNLDGLNKAIMFSSQLQQRSLGPGEIGHLHYVLGNAWSNLHALTNTASPWENRELERAVFHFRSALNNEDWIAAAPKQRVCQVLTNLGNGFSGVGRVVEAFELWDDALTRVPKYGMTVGNKGYGLVKYASAASDPGHARFILTFARDYLARSVTLPLETDAARKFFRDRLAEVESAIGKKGKPGKSVLDSFPLGRSQHEVRYRQWCLKQRLFLNPLNDLGEHAIAARDRLTLPSMVRPINEGPIFHGLFNQLKQEFVSARFFYYEGLQAVRAHFSDRGVYQHNTLDYPSYSLNVERVKAAFRLSYSVFDKIAFFLNEYLELRMPVERVSFRRIWYTNGEKKKGIRSDIQDRRNWPLQALFWVSKDLTENRPEFRESMNPDSQLLADIRNHLEHRYLKLHEGEWSGPTDDPSYRFMEDSLALSLYRPDFERKALRILKLVRAALIYLTMSVRWEEHRQAKARGDAAVMPMSMDAWEDDWKS